MNPLLISEDNAVKTEIAMGENEKYILANESDYIEIPKLYGKSITEGNEIL